MVSKDNETSAYSELLHTISGPNSVIEPQMFFALPRHRRTWRKISANAGATAWSSQSNHMFLKGVFLRRMPKKIRSIYDCHVGDTPIFRPGNLVFIHSTRSSRTASCIANNIAALTLVWSVSSSLGPSPALASSFHFIGINEHAKHTGISSDRATDAPCKAKSNGVGSPQQPALPIAQTPDMHIATLI